MKKIYKIPKNILAGIIWIYQKIFSFDHGFLKVFYPYGFCKFYPTCSEYSKQAVLKYGIIKGVALSIRRLSHCHPFSQSRVDLLN